MKITMFEILMVIAFLAGSLLAARKGRGRRRFNLRRVRITPELALVTLAADTALVIGTTGFSNVPYRVMSLKTAWSIVAGTGGEGPVTVGYAHSDYTVTEIKECLEAFLSISPGLKIEQEKANRLIRIVGTIQLGTTGSGGQELNDGKPITTKLNWLIDPAKQVNVFAFNEDSDALSTGAVLHCQGDMWVKDSV